jgi:hypothetical protein
MWGRKSLDWKPCFEDTYAAAPRHTAGILTEALNDCS